MADLTRFTNAEEVQIVTEGGNTLSVNADGSVNASRVDGQKATYSASAAGFACAAAATDIFTIAGSATKTIRITRVSLTLSTTSGSGVMVTTSLLKRSAANTGGTFVSDTAIPHDSSIAAATAVVGHYTANPTGLGTLTGAVRSARTQANYSGTYVPPLVWHFGNRPGQAIVLRGAAQVLTLNLNAVSVTGPIVSVDVEWTEE